ncbi:MAG: major capsid protein [Succinivibrio sp.]|nr:major capsid protein [Succinivibrio sp.]
MALNQIDLFTHRTLLGVIEKTIKSQTFLRDQFFPTIRNFDTETVDVDIVDRRDRTIAKFSAEDGQGHINYRKGFITENFRPAYVCEKFVITGKDLRKRAPGEPIYQGGLDLDMANRRMRFEVARGLQDIENKMTRLEEWMIAQAILTGKVPVKGLGVDAEFNFWRYLNASEKPVTNLTTAWTASGAKPLDDLNLICEDIAKQVGLVPREFIMGTKVWRALRNHLVNDGKATLDIRRIELGNIAPRKADTNAVSYKGHLLDPDLDLYVYTGNYQGEDGKIHYYIPDDVGVIVCEDAEKYTYRAYGSVSIVDDATGVTSLAAAPRVPDAWVQRDTPSGQVVRVQSAPLMILSEPRAFHVVKGAA